MSDTRQRIIDATNELFRAQGFNGTSLKQITEQANAPIGSIYHFFPGGKDQLGATTLRESGAAYQLLLELIMDEATDVVEAIGALFEGASDALTDMNFIDICPIGTVAREIASTHEPLRQATESVFKNWTVELSRRFSLAGLTAADANDLATTVISSIEGGFILARASRNTDGLRSTGRHMQRLVRATIEGAT